MFNRLFCLIIKELITALRDTKARAILIVVPFIQLFILSFTITQEVKNLAVGFYNKDTGKEGYSLIERFEHSQFFGKILFLNKQEDIYPLIDRQTVMGVIVIPQDFSQKIYARQTADVQILLDGRRTNAALISGGYAGKIIHQFFAEKTNGKSAVLETRHWFNVNLDPRKTTVPALVCILATILGTFLSGLSIAREREHGTFEQLLVSPLTAFEILVGKAVPALLLAMCSAGIMVGCVVFLLGIPFNGSPFLFIISMSLFLLCVIGIGLFISSLAATQQQAILGIMLVLPPFVMLSGFVTPVENMPFWLQYLTVCNPVRWYLIIVKGVFIKGMDLYETAINCIPLVLISTVTLSAATFMFKQRTAN